MANDINVSAIYDSGANVSLISSACCKKLGIVSLLGGVSPVDTMNGTLISKGSIWIKLKIFNIEKYVPFLCVEGKIFSDDLLLGLDIIKSFKLRQDENLQISQNCAVHLEEKNNSVCLESEFPVDNYKNTLSLTRNKDIDCFESIHMNLEDIITKYDNVFAKEKFDTGTILGFEAQIKLTENKYIARKPYKCSYSDKIEIESQIKKLLKAGLIEESYSPYAAPVTLVYKKDENKKSRLCIDYTGLNKYVVPETYPFPRIDDLVEKVGKCVYFSKLDINSAFWTIPLRKKDKYKTAFVTHHGHWQWCCLPFGLKSAPAIFQRILANILRNGKLSRFTINYIDDILIYSETYEEHLLHIQETLKVLQDYNLKLNTNKCSFAKKEVKYLGHSISNNTVKPLNDNLTAIQNFPIPQTKKNVKQFLGKVNFYLKYIPRAAIILEPLHNLLRKNVDFYWSNECQNSFDKVKQCLCTEPILAIFDYNKPIYIFTDASLDGVGAILKQPQENNILKPVFYFSKKLSPSQKRKRAIFIECLAIKEALQYWQYQLIGKHFKIFTDHKPLHNFNIKNCTDNDLIHLLHYISQFDFEIIYNPGINNSEADCLSRNPVLPDKYNLCESKINIVNLITKEDIITDQKKIICDKFCSKENSIIYRKLNNKKKIWVTESFGISMLNKIHKDYGHIGVKQMTLMITPDIYFKNMHKHIKLVCRNCEVCLRNKIRCGEIKAPLSQLGPASYPLEIVSIDTIGGFNNNNSSHKYMHLMVDHFTRYAFIITSKTQVAKDFIKLVGSAEKVGKIGTILADHYPAINSKEFKSYLKTKNINLVFTAIDCAFSNGLNERTNQTLVNKIRCKVFENKKLSWAKLAEQCITEYNNTVHSSTRFSPGYLLFGVENSVLPKDLSKNNIDDLNKNREIAFENSRNNHDINKYYYDKGTKDIDFKVNDIVYVKNGNKLNRNKMDPIKIGPFKIVKKISNNIFEIDTGRKKKDVDLFHRSKIIPFLGPSNLS